MFDLFTNTFVQALEKHAPIKTRFIRNDKNNFSLSEKWISNTTRQVMINRENFLNDENFKQFFSCRKNSSTSSFSEDYKKFYQNLIEAAESDRKKWLLINEIRNSKKKFSRT